MGPAGSAWLALREAAAATIAGDRAGLEAHAEIGAAPTEAEISMAVIAWTRSVLCSRR
jgi:hypothetical protein